MRALHEPLPPAEQRAEDAAELRSIAGRIAVIAARNGVYVHGTLARLEYAALRLGHRSC